MQRPIAKFVMGLHQSWRAIAGFTTAIVKPTIGIIIYEIAKNYYVIAIAFFTAFAYRAFRQGALRFGAIAYWFLTHANLVVDMTAWFFSVHAVFATRASRFYDTASRV